MKYVVVSIATIYDGYPHSVDSEVVSKSIDGIYTFSSKKAAYTYVQGCCHSAINVYKFSVNSPVKYVNGVNDHYTEIIINRNMINDFIKVEYLTFTQSEYESWLEELMDTVCEMEHTHTIYDGLNEHYTSKLESQIMDIYVGYSRAYNGENYDKDLHDMYYLAL